MADYRPPRVRIFQDLSTAIAAPARRATAFIFGGHAYLSRYANSDEKLLAYIGSYDHVGANVDGEWKTCYSWPLKPVGSIIDESYTKLKIDNALLRIFNDTGHTMTKKSATRVRHPTKIFATNGAYTKSSDFGDRGVKVGDLVRVTTNGGDEVLFSYVKGFIGEAIAAVTGTAAADSANQATAIATSSQTRAANASGELEIASLDHTSYSGYIDGDVQETYTVEVLEASIGGDLTTAVLRVTSASGNDDDAEATPAAAGYPTSIGSRGLTATFDVDTGSDFIVGDKWTITVREAWTKTVPTAAGTYTGTVPVTYIVEVTTGGISDAEPSDDPYVTVTTTTNVDYGDPVSVPTSAATAVPIGQYGVTMAFSTAKLRKGDRFTVTATPASEGAYKTLVLGHSLDSSLALDDDTIDMELEIFLKADLSVDENHVTNSGDVNWQQSNTEFCAMAAVEAKVSSWTVSGVITALPVISVSQAGSSYNRMYLEYRAWRSDLASVTTVLTDPDDIDVIPGPLSPDNPFKYAFYKALINSAGQPVYGRAVADPDDIASWAGVLDQVETLRAAYGLVPLTKDQTVLDLVQGHANSQSNENNKRYRVLWANPADTVTKAIATAALSSDEAVILATTADDSNTSGTQYTQLQVTSGNFSLETAGVRPGDIVRFKYTTDAWGVTAYSEYVVDSVVNEDTLLLVSGTTAAESTPIKVEIWRNLSLTEQADEAALLSGNYADRRVRAVWPPEAEDAGLTVPGYFVCAAWAGKASGVEQNQGLTNSTINGFDKLPKTSQFNETQLNTLAGNGMWITAVDPANGSVFCRHAVTTGDTADINQREEMLTRNWDLCSMRFDDQFSPYIGKANAVPDMLDIISAEFEAAKEDLRQVTKPELGPMLLDATITELRISPVFKDTILISGTFFFPYSLNGIDFHMLV